jgi:hypothetical protein
MKEVNIFVLYQRNFLKAEQGRKLNWKAFLTGTDSAVTEFNILYVTKSLEVETHRFCCKLEHYIKK